MKNTSIYKHVQAYWTSITSWHLILWVKYVKLYVPPTKHKLILNYSSYLLFHLGRSFTACFDVWVLLFTHIMHSKLSFLVGPSCLLYRRADLSIIKTYLNCYLQKGAELSFKWEPTCPKLGPSGLRADMYYYYYYYQNNVSG